MNFLPTQLVRHPVGLAGIWLTTVSSLLFLAFFAFNVFGFFTNPYLGIIFLLILPGFFVVGLVLIPVGAWLDRRAERLGHPRAGTHWPIWDLNQPRQRWIAFFILAATFVNLVVISLAAYRGVEYMDSVPFCGQVCHTVMKPEFTAYEDGPHARVRCVQCHIGPGAPWFVRSKLSGTRQVFAVAFDTYPRPIPSPVENLRPARETCEQCHWPQMFTGDIVVGVHEFAPDEANTESTTTLRLHVGGANPLRGEPTGVHWHIAKQIEYITTDPKRQTIPWVKVDYGNGEVRIFTAEGVPAEPPPAGETRPLDCMDCHNRPSHPFAPTADRAIDAAMAATIIPRTLPYIRREATEAVKATYPTQAAAAEAIAARLRKFYQDQYPQIYAGRRAEVDSAISGTTYAYTTNVFPEMHVTFGTYLNNLGHMFAPGCFRCHDDAHTSADGKVISQDCTLCHELVQ